MVLAAFVWWSTAGVLERQTDAAIETESQNLSERYAEDGLPGLIELIRQRMDTNIDDDAVYLLTDPAYKPLVGNLDKWPPTLTIDRERDEFRLMRTGGPAAQVIARRFELPGGFHLLVGRDVESKNQLSGLIANAMLWAAFIAVALGSVGALLVRSLFRATLADVSATAGAIGMGDLTRRVRISGQGDEFDRLAETINDMLERIEQLMDGVRQVSNAIAHDLRTPIARARARLEDAATHAHGEEELRAAVERAVTDLDGIVAIFQALLRIAEIEAGARRSAFAPFDAAPVLRDMGELYEAVAEDKGQRLVVDLPERLTMVGDRDLLQQAVANLLDNALKFTPEGGTIALSAGVEASGVVVSVADGGPGMAEEDMARATERFFRGDQARNTPGSGLGLALVAAVAALHGGSLTLEDNAPGLRAVLRLRAAPDA